MDNIIFSLSMVPDAITERTVYTAQYFLNAFYEFAAEKGDR